ncbi:hypothetical protein [Nocardia brasiliensis]|uniref:hypothetical protein n=1 Tax=Nocardia brasiliensis TaxID=37326 RepID=UPI00245753B1|nr:hypothetical protein [Nocardia brasiliensis]
MPPSGHVDHHRRWRVSPGYLGTCPACGKAAFRSRKTAKQYARRRYPGAGLRAYECLRRAGAWHVGHPAPEVVTGAVSKQLFYGPGGIGAHRHRCGTRRIPKGRP